MMLHILFILFLTQGFAQKWSIPKGINYGGGRMPIADTDRDGNWELIFRTDGGPYTIYFYELHLPNTWEIDSVTCLYAPILWDMGDFDNDGLMDIVMQWGSSTRASFGIAIFESPDSFSYPTQEVWRDTVRISTVAPISAYDIDRDGFPEILQTGGEPGQNYYIDFSIYESVGDNHYEVKYQFESPETPVSTLAAGDFDADNRIEFVLGCIDGDYQIWECIGNDNYYLIQQQQVPIVSSLKDVLTVADADGDGKLEFILKGGVSSIANVNTFIFEAIGDNTYEIIKSLILPSAQSFDYYEGHSDTGDLDGDGRPEIALEAASYVYLIKGVSNDSFIIWYTLPGHEDGSSVRVFDIDNNGLSEVIISGGNYTRIYEKTPFVTWFCPTPYDTFYANDTVYPRWRLDETISLDSLRLYWSHPQLGCHLIYQGLATDTICSFVVPDTQSNMSNKFWLVTKGYGRYDSTYSPVFYIKRTGIEETVGGKEKGIGLWVSPNPFSEKINIRYRIEDNQKSEISLKIYDATGRMVRDFSRLTFNIECFAALWDGMDDSGNKLPAGVYFLRLDGPDKVLIQKVIKLE